MKTQGKDDGEGVAPHQGARRLGGREGAEAPARRSRSSRASRSRSSPRARAARRRSGRELERLGAPRTRVRAARGRADAGRDRASGAFSKPGWIFELKYDGYRVLAAREDGAAAPPLPARHATRRRPSPRSRARSRALPFEALVLDGEVVVLDEKARPELRAPPEAGAAPAPRRHRAGRGRAAGDALRLRPARLRGLRPAAAAARRAQGAARSSSCPRAGPLRFADHVEEQGEALLAEVARAGPRGRRRQEGRRPVPRAAARRDWLKVRLDRTRRLRGRRLHAAARAPRSGFGALHLAAYDGRRPRLRRPGRQRLHREAARRDPRGRSSRARRATPPCAGPAADGQGATSGSSRALVCEVRYKEWTDEGLLRQPVFLRLRDDKPPEECVREDAAARGAAGRRRRAERRSRDRSRRRSPSPTSTRSSGPTRATPRATSSSTTARSRPGCCRTSQDRPLVLTRYPDGIAGKSLLPEGRARASRRAGSALERMWSEHAAARDRLLRLRRPRVAALRRQPRLDPAPRLGEPRRARSSSPDWCILDLDPKGAPFAHVVEVARAIHALCEEIGLPAFIKTSGATGLHVLLPLGRPVHLRAVAARSARSSPRSSSSSLPRDRHDRARCSARAAARSTSTSSRTATARRSPAPSRRGPSRAPPARRR